MNNIIFNGCWIGANMVGVNRYAYNLINEFDKILENVKVDFNIEIAVPKSSNFKMLKLKNIKIVKIGNSKNKFQKLVWEQFTFPNYVRKKNAISVDLTLSFPISGDGYVAIHDCIHEVFPENYVGHKIHRFLYLFKIKCIMCNKKKKIITVSKNSKNEIMKYYHISSNRISVIGNGWEHMTDIEPDYSIYKKLNIKSEYFFSLGSKYKHKNLEWVLRTARVNPQYSFILTGNDSFSKEINNLENDKPTNVIFTGFVSDGEMKALMLGCKALIQPSLYEGFGIPPLEALSLGRKIIISNVSCLPEIYEDTAYYIDPYGKGCDLNDLLKENVNSPELVLSKHSWKKSAAELFKLIIK
ncbi:MAG: glycosyltransferase family 4 protein [Candidatus Gastranaerophilaceae bacterium]